MNEIYELRLEIEKRGKIYSKNDMSIEEMKSRLQSYERENQSLKDENVNKKNVIDTILHQNNELLKLNHAVSNRNQTENDGDMIKKSSASLPHNDFQRPTKTAYNHTPLKTNTNDTFISTNRFGNRFYDEVIQETQETTDDYCNNQ